MCIVPPSTLKLESVVVLDGKVFVANVCLVPLMYIITLSFCVLLSKSQATTKWYQAVVSLYKAFVIKLIVVLYCLNLIAPLASNLI